MTVVVCMVEDSEFFGLLFVTAVQDSMGVFFRMLSMPFHSYIVNPWPAHDFHGRPDGYILALGCLAGSRVKSEVSQADNTLDHVGPNQHFTR